MKIKKAASIPLVLSDPYFSIWSSTDHLYDSDPVHWSGIRQKMRGYLTVNGKTYAFLGDKEFHACLPQTGVEVSATATTYTFENEEAAMKLTFTSPILPYDLIYVSRPCTYMDVEVEKKQEGEVVLDFEVSADLVRQGKDKVVGYNSVYKAKDGSSFAYASMGRAKQEPLGSSGDKVVIDWGYAYIASQEKNVNLYFDSANEKIGFHLPSEEGQIKASFMLAYDDLLSINYFGQWRKAYWTNTYATILEAMAAAFADKEEVCQKAAALDAEVEKEALAVGGEGYAFLCNMSFRHAFAAHKLITDEEGNVIFLSKENDSNGCIGTVDVSYPSVPFFLLYNTEYVKGMLRPVFKFAACDVWTYDFAPHDVGRYPYAWGQVYGLTKEFIGEAFTRAQGDPYPPFYQYPAEPQLYDFAYQMPVEECGNMLVLTAAVCMQDGNPEFARPYMDTLKQWTKYLLTYGADPGEQLCTDDFAGHLSHNVNLSAKAIMGIEAYSKLLAMLGNAEEAAWYHEKAKEMAKDWEKRADAGDHYVLAFGREDTWSLKYNLVWDKVWGSGLFSDEVYEKEYAYYIQKTNEFGTPLDSRRSYTKSDWILWCAAMAKDSEQAGKLIAPVANYLENTVSRVPFSDWYDTITSKYEHFIGRSVQGGIFMPTYMKRWKHSK